MDIDLSFLFEEPRVDVRALLKIQPLAPLSMVNSMPGSYYKTEHAPTKFMLCGLMENILGFHFSVKDRERIRKDLRAHLKKMRKMDFPNDESPVGYVPLVYHLFTIGPLAQPQPILYEDLWTQHLIGSDERHLKGVTNYDWRLEAKIVRMNRIEDTGAKTKARNEFFESNKRLFPRYYRSPQRREFLVAEKPYEIALSMSKGLFNRLIEAIKVSNHGYLGTSEGWVHVELEEFS